MPNRDGGYLPHRHRRASDQVEGMYASLDDSVPDYPKADHFSARQAEPAARPNDDCRDEPDAASVTPTATVAIHLQHASNRRNSFSHDTAIRWLRARRPPVCDLRVTGASTPVSTPSGPTADGRFTKRGLGAARNCRRRVSARPPRRRLFDAGDAGAAAPDRTDLLHVTAALASMLHVT